MGEFDRLCKQIEQLDPSSFTEIISEKSANVVSALAAITKNGIDGVGIYLNFILCSVAADGKLAEEEFQLLKSPLEKLLGKELTYAEAKTVFKNAGLDKSKDYKKAVDLMVDVLGLVSPELKADIITVCMMICAIDGKISRKEKKWIAQLID